MDSRMQASTQSRDPVSQAEEWAALCRARTAAKKAHDKLFGAAHGKFSTRGNGSVRVRPSAEEISQAEAVRDSLNDIEKQMFAILRDRG